jgi:hypothetical protein
VLVGSFGTDRDYAHGEARRLWDEALASGAVRVDTEEEALADAGAASREA